jgi:hypothetical protein
VVVAALPVAGGLTTGVELDVVASLELVVTGAVDELVEESSMENAPD